MKDNIKVVQSSLLGSILVNLLLVLGSAIIAGCITESEVAYNTDLTQSFVGLLNLTISCLMIPVRQCAKFPNFEYDANIEIERFLWERQKR